MITIQLSDEGKDVIIRALRLLLLVGEERESLVAAQLIYILQPKEQIVEE